MEGVMKFVICKKPSESFEWLFIVEQGRVTTGDIVGTTYHGYMEVVRVGATRAAVESVYTGAVRVIERVQPHAVEKAVRNLWAAEKRLDQARTALREARGDLGPGPNLKTFYGTIKISKGRGLPRVSRG